MLDNIEDSVAVFKINKQIRKIDLNLIWANNYFK